MMNLILMSYRLLYNTFMKYLFHPEAIQLENDLFPKD